MTYSKPLDAQWPPPPPFSRTYTVAPGEELRIVSAATDFQAMSLTAKLDDLKKENARLKELNENQRLSIRVLQAKPEPEYFLRLPYAGNKSVDIYRLDIRDELEPYATVQGLDAARVTVKALNKK